MLVLVSAMRNNSVWSQGESIRASGGKYFHYYDQLVVGLKYCSGFASCVGLQRCTGIACYFGCRP